MGKASHQGLVPGAASVVPCAFYFLRPPALVPFYGATGGHAALEQLPALFAWDAQPVESGWNRVRITGTVRMTKTAMPSVVSG